MMPQGGFDDRSGNQGFPGEQFNNQGGQGGQGGNERQMQPNRPKPNMAQAFKGPEQMIKQMETKIKSLKAKNVSIPANIEQTISEVKVLIASAKESSSNEDSDPSDAMSDVQDKMQDLQDVFPQLQMLGEWPRIEKQATKQLAMMKKEFERSKKQALKSKIDVSSIVARVETSLAEIEKSIADAKAQASAGNIEDAMDSLRDSVFEASDDLRDQFRILESMGNVGRIYTRISKDIASFEKEVKRLAKQKDPETGELRDVSKLNELVVEAKNFVADIKSKIDSKAEPEEIFDALSDGESLQNDIMEEMSHVKGQDTAIDKMFNPASGSQGKF